MEIKKTAQQIFENNKAKGFWDEPRNFGEMLMLVTSELAEALEADRLNFQATLTGLAKINMMGQEDEVFKSLFVEHVKDTKQDEISDAIIRLLDISEGLGIDLEWHIKAKMRYNLLRPHMHGKKY